MPTTECWPLDLADTAEHEMFDSYEVVCIHGAEPAMCSRCNQENLFNDLQLDLFT